MALVRGVLNHIHNTSTDKSVPLTARCKTRSETQHKDYPQVGSSRIRSTMTILNDFSLNRTLVWFKPDLIERATIEGVVALNASSRSSGLLGAKAHPALSVGSSVDSGWPSEDSGSLRVLIRYFFSDAQCVQSSNQLQQPYSKHEVWISISLGAIHIFTM